jgi:hypothetical protein
MARKGTRRTFFKTAAAGGALASLGELAFLSRFRPVSATEAKLEPGVVRLSPEIEPVVRLLEETPQEKLLEEVASRIRGGLSYRELLAALLLAGVRNVQPRPQVGFKFHAVLVVNSAHLASVSSPDTDRWLPIFWALDYFKSAQARDIEEGNWTMGPVDEQAVPRATHARRAFVEAMDDWNAEAADASVAGLARTAGAAEIFELFFRYGARDFRSIGHKAIFVANSWRTLQCIGWQHAEPVLRSLAYALVNHEGEPHPASNDLEADRPWRGNTERATAFRAEWQEGQPSRESTGEMLAVLRDASWDQACDKAVELLNHGVAPQSIWDALLAGAGELLMRQSGIISLHAMTTTNALRFAYQSSGDDHTRRMLLLQNVAFLPLFRQRMLGRGEVSDNRVDGFHAMELTSSGDEAIEEIFAEASRDRMVAAQKILSYLHAGRDARPLINRARQLIFLKGTDSHDYKFSSAVLEDYYHLSHDWRDRYLAASVFNLRGSGDSDNALVERTRAALTG